MRKKAVAALVGILALALAGVALASGFTQHSNITFTTTKARTPTGIKANVFSTIPPGEPTGQYKPAKLLIVTFPSGTKFNLTTIKPCTLSDKALASGTACPASTKVGTGTAQVVAPPLSQKFNATAVAYVTAPKVMTIVATARVTGLPAQRVVIHESIVGAKLKIPVPATKVGPYPVVLVKLTLNVPKRGSMIKAGTCTTTSAGKVFVIKSHFVYKDGSTTDLVSTSACS
jgi:hypothetical protein